jgi:outer membrane lipoprotein-sorting protein
MKWCIILCIALGLNGFTFLNGQVRAKPESESILIHSTMQLGSGASLEMVTSTKNQKYIRASIHNSSNTVGATIVYNGKSIKIVEETSDKSTARILSGEEAAANLFDLVALNPEYHFNANEGLNFKISTFKGYRVELQREATPVAETERFRPTKMLLYKVAETGDTLIRSIDYLSYFEKIDPYLQPKEITFTDEAAGETGRITVQKVDYNVGLPNFLFELPDPK